MILLVIVLAIIVIAIFVVKYFDSPELEKTVKLSEDKIVNKFNNLLKKISPRNIETVKKELLDTLDQYKAVKKAQFVEARSLITSSISAVEEKLRISVESSIRREMLSIRLKEMSVNKREHNCVTTLTCIRLWIKI